MRGVIGKGFLRVAGGICSQRSSTPAYLCFPEGTQVFPLEGAPRGPSAADGAHGRCNKHPSGLELLFKYLLAWSSAAEREGHKTPRLNDAGSLFLP